mgnify:CR=1 FL=1
MNMCIVSEYKCIFEVFKDLVEGSQEEVANFVTEYELIKVNDHKSVLLLNVTDMDACRKFMTTPEMKQWDEENGCVDIVYSMERIN